MLATCEGDTLTLAATDLDVGLRYVIPNVKATHGGRCILPVAKLVNILRESNDAEVSITAGTDGTLVKLGRSKYELPGGDPDEFPEFPAFEDKGEALSLTAGVLRLMIKRTNFAAEKRENTRFAVTGLMFEVGEASFKIIATDTKRLAVCEAAIESPKPVSALVPLKSIQLLQAILGDDAERISVSLHANEAMFRTERATLYTRLIEGKFPSYQQFLPKKLPTKLTLPVAEFPSRVRQAAITTDEESKRVDFHFQPGGLVPSRLTLAARGPTSGSSDVEMELPEYDGPEIQISFDPTFITEFLKVIQDAETSVQLELTAALDRAVFRVGESYFYLVVPMAG